MKTYYVYIMASRSRTLYTGVTNDLQRRVLEHKKKMIAGFTVRYTFDRLVYCQAAGSIYAAIHPEKQIKGWVRSKKLALITACNPEWRDLSDAWWGQADSSLRSE